MSALFLLGESSASAQHWSETTPETDRHWVSIAPYFINENIGFVFTNSTELTELALLRTNDGGTTWATILKYSDIGLVTQMYFVSASRGYFSCTSGIYESVDTGLTWKKITLDSVYFHSVYAINSKVFAYGGGSLLNVQYDTYGPLIVTDDRGGHWDTIIPRTNGHFGTTYLTSPEIRPYVFGNKDSLVFAVDGRKQSNLFLMVSTNGGKNWVSNEIDSSDRYVTTGLFVFPHCTDLLRTKVSALKEDTYDILYSSDFGEKWIRSKDSTETGAWIAGNNCAVYITNGDVPPAPLPRNLKGVYRSTDRGKNWMYINGPGDGSELDDWDLHNLSVVGGGAVIYQGEFGGKVCQKSVDGGDGLLSVKALRSIISINHFSSSNEADTLYYSDCDSALVQVIFQNLNCNYAHLDSLGIIGLDSSEYAAITTQHLLCEDAPDTMTISIYPYRKETRSIDIGLHFSNDEFIKIDTGFSLVLKKSNLSKSGVHFSSARIINDSINIIIHLPIYIHRSGSMNDVDMIMHYPTVSLKYQGGLSYNGRSIDVARSQWAGRAGVHFSGADINAAPDSLLGYANFLWSPFEFNCDYIIFDSIQTSEAPCAGSAIPFQGIIGSDKSCGVASVTNGKNIQFDFSISPNPAEKSIEVILNKNTPFRYELFNALGVTEKRGTSKENILKMNVSDLPSGNYYLRVTDSNGMVATKKVIIMR